jgi:cation diffusion facilitator CzcD-associated flavoprotein CzcO
MTGRAARAARAIVIGAGNTAIDMAVQIQRPARRKSRWCIGAASTR